MPRFFSAFQRIAVAGTATATFVLAGCSDSTSSPNRAISSDGASLSQNPDIFDATGRHVFHTKEWFENDARQNGNANGRGGGGGGTGISYHGGPVLQANTNVAAVYWAGSPIFTGGPDVGTTGSGANDGSLVGYFLSNLGGSSYFNINSSYTDGSGRHIVNSVHYTQFWANGTNAPTGTKNVTDADMVAMLQSGFDFGKLTYDASTLYAIFTSGQVNLGGGFGTQYCAYHTHGTVVIGGKNMTVLYAAMPYNYAYKSSCTNGTAAPNGDPGADAEVNTLAHEIEETTTDMMGNAWFDVRGYENADKCAWNWGATSTVGGGVWNITVGAKHFLVQQNWVNAGSGGCAQAYP